MRSYWFRDIIQQNHFHIFWEEGKKNLADYVTKHHPIWYHRTMRPRYVKATKKKIEKSKDQKNRTSRGCDGTTNPWETRKMDNPLKVIRNTIPQNPENTLKIIRNLVKTESRSSGREG